MIIRMLKYSFLVFHEEYEAFLEWLREQGVVHIETKTADKHMNPEIEERRAWFKRYDSAIKGLSSMEPVTTDPGQFTSGKEVLEAYEKNKHEAALIANELEGVNDRFKKAAPWGIFDRDQIIELEERGVYFHFFSCQDSKFNEDWRKKYVIETISKKGATIYFVVMTDTEQVPGLDATYHELPQSSIDTLSQQRKELSVRLNEIKHRQRILAGHLDLLKISRAEQKDQINFTQAIDDTLGVVEEKVMLLEGWVPQNKVKNLDNGLDALGVYYESRKAIPDDDPPVKLRNNRFAKLFEPIGELYTLPIYGELDLTPFFAPFFLLFFGFCLGDAGYGLLIVIAATIYKRRAKPALKPFLTLGQLLGLATTIMGALSGTFFGIFLLESNIAWIEDYKRYMLDQDNLMTLSLILGYVQICFGMILNIVNKVLKYGFSFALATVGWAYIVISGGIFFALFHFNVWTQSEAINNFLYFVLLPGLVFAYFFNTPGGGVLLNFGKGLWETYTITTGLLGDLLSYIRLFALGIASAVLGNVFNQLAFELSGNIPVLSHIVMLLILLFGHSLNLFMAGLGAFVHPLRLTFVEFYKNSDFEGGGKKYDPFKTAKIDL